MAKSTHSQTLLIGRLGQDPEVRSSTSGSSVATLNVGENYVAGKDDSGQWIERVEWHRVTLFGRTAEIAQEYLKKGSAVMIVGVNRTRKWQDQNGQDRYSTTIVGNDLHLMPDACSNSHCETTLIGRMGGDPIIRTTSGGHKVANLNVGETYLGAKDPATGKRAELTEWHTVTVFDREAETAEKTLKKGALVYVSGVNRTRKWQDQAGTNQYRLEIKGSKLVPITINAANSSSAAQPVAQQGTRNFQQPALQQSTDRNKSMRDEFDKIDGWSDFGLDDQIEEIPFD